MFVDKLFGKKDRASKYNFPLIKRGSKKDEVSDQVKKLLGEEDQKLILMVRG
jgi:hypothetical protein